MPDAYAEMAWNMIQQIERGERDKAEIVLCKKYLRQGYAAAAISKQNVLKDSINKYYTEYFKEAIYLPSPSPNGEPHRKICSSGFACSQ